MPETLKTFRIGFPALKQRTYLSICDKMILHDAVRASVDEFLDALALASADRTQHEVKVARSRERFAKLMGLTTDEVAVTRNVSDGINTVIWAYPWGEGDNAVLTLDLEHPNNAYPWLRLRKRGVEVRAVPAAPGGRLDYAAMADAMDARTRIVSFASVSYAPGLRADISRIAEAAHKVDAMVLVDGVQSAGILRHNLNAEGVDAFATSTSKGLLGLYGFGFLGLAARWIDRLEPAFLSRPAVASDDDSHSAMGSYDYALQPSARRFELGGYNLAGAYAADASLGLLAQVGGEAIEAQTLAVARRLRAGLKEMGLLITEPLSGE
ncbi:MAG: aminotransferase class V-fold PLP-dependent enzyme [Pseudomonadota bacterium]